MFIALQGVAIGENAALVGVGVQVHVEVEASQVVVVLQESVDTGDGRLRVLVDTGLVVALVVRE